jgi:NitT/TauT family transport system substrate-binding protein
MGLFSRTLIAAAVMVGSALSVTGANAAIRIAFGDIASIESLHILAAIERAKERGVAIEVTFFQAEDIAAQAIVGGQADVGIGAPYGLIQRVNAPIRIFAQVSTLRFFPVVNSEFYRTWEDLNGQEIAVQGRGSGTEAIMMLMARVKNIQYSRVSYVPGSEVRAGALLQGTIRASIVDAANRRLLEQQAPGKFIVLPLDEISATDEALFANTEFLAGNQAEVDILVEEFLKVLREVNDNPAAAVDLRRQYNLLPDLGPQADEEILAYFTETAEAGAFPLNGGGPDAAADDLGFTAAAGQIEGDPATLDPNDFWDFGPLERALAVVGPR